MSRPEGIVRGKFSLVNGAPALGRVHFTPSPERVVVYTTEPPLIILPPVVTVLLDSDGAFLTPLLATSGEGVNPSGWTYKVEVDVPGVWETPYYIQVPLGGEVDLADYVPVPESGGSYTEEGVRRVVAGDNVFVDSTDPLRPVVSAIIPEGIPAAPHTHQIAEVEGLEGKLSEKQPLGDYLTTEDLPEYPDLSTYALKSELFSGDYGDLIDPPEIPSSPQDVGAAPELHSHSVSDVENLQEYLDAKQPTGDYLTLDDLPDPVDLEGFVQEGDPRLTDSRDPNSHSHLIEDVEGLGEVLDGKQEAGDYLKEGDLPPIPSQPSDIGAATSLQGEKADSAVQPQDIADVVREDDTRLTDSRTPKSHTHQISEVEGLEGELSGKQPVGDYLEEIPEEIALSADEVVTSITINGDQTPTGGWPDRWRWLFRPHGGSPRLVSWVNEYGEQRYTPANQNTVGWRLFARSSSSDPAHVGDVWQICDNRTDRNVIASVDEGGLRAKNLPNSMVVSDTPPTNPAKGDVWIDTSEEL